MQRSRLFGFMFFPSGDSRRSLSLLRDDPAVGHQGERHTAAGAGALRPDTAAPDEDRRDFEDFIENSGIACHIIGADGIVVHANRAKFDLLGVTPKDLIGRPVAEFHADPDTAEDMVARLARGERLQRFPARLRARDGSVRHVEITSVSRLGEGRLTSTRCFLVDATELAHAREQIRRQDERLRQLLDALPAAVYTTDAAGNLTYYNAAAARLAGRKPELGKDKWCVSLRLRRADGEEMPFEQCPMATAIKEDREIRGIEATAERPDGTLVPVLPFPTPLHDESGSLVGAVNMLVDISERKQAETRQRMMLDELNHRVKNNMQMLHVLLQEALRETGNAEARKVLGDASQRVRAMAAAQQLLYSDGDPRGFAAGRFLRAVCGRARQAFDRDICVSIKSDRCRLSNDAAMPLALILNELLANAARQEHDQGAKLNIAVALKRENGEFVLSVSDAGSGFDLEESGRRASGLGLVRGLSRQLGGSFAVERDAGTCIVRFPAARAQV